MFETRARAKQGTPRRRGLAALGVLAALALAAAGCGGGADSGGESEAAARKKLEAGADKISHAKSLRASILFEVEEDGDAEEIGCLDMAVDTRKPERFDLSFFDLNCSGGAESHEMIAVGHRAWGSSEPGSWTAAKIAPELLHELDDEQTDLTKLLDAAEDIKAVPRGGAVEEGNGTFVDVTEYSFEAPASAFPGSDDIGDVQVEFDATVDRHGFLRELVVHGDEDGAGATVTANYDDIDQDLGIAPPDPGEVHGTVTKVETRDQLDALFGLPSS